MTEIVEAVKESQWMKDGVEATTYWVTLVDGVGQREVPCYDPRGKDLKEDAPLPEGWEVKTSKAGKLYLAAPRMPGKGAQGSPKWESSSSWRNTEAGAKYEQERMDRRTALMQAVGSGGSNNWLIGADAFYAWLRKSVSAPRSVPEPGTGAGGEWVGTAPAQAGPRPAVGADTPSDEGGEQLNSPTHREAASPSSTSSDDCYCGQPWGPNTTASGKHVCLAGHVERVRVDYA
jgi:hypothetical protein